MKNLIALQDEYVATVNGGRLRWAHRKNGGHISRITRGARRKLESGLRKWEYTDAQIQAAVKDARDVADLEYNAL